MNVEQVAYEEVQPFAAMAAREGVSVKHTPETTWFAVRASSGRILAFGGVLVKPTAAGRLARLKGVWCSPEERGQGHYRALIVERLRWSLEQGADVMELYQVKHGRPGLWPAWGFTFQSERLNGARHFRASRADIEAILMNPPGGPVGG